MAENAEQICHSLSESEPDLLDLNALSPEQLRACVEVSKSITAELDPARLIPTIMEKVSKLLPSETWSLFLLDEATQTLKFEISMDIDLETVKNFRLALGQGVAGKAAQLQRLLVVGDVSQCEYFFDQVDGTTGRRTEALICVPILYAGRTLGVLEVVNPKRMDAAMLMQLRLLSDYLAIAIENTRRYQVMEELAVRDNLTGLFNQRYLYPTLKRQILRCRNAGHPLSLVFMDMDNFKTVVDRLGHLNGSRALSEVAQRIQACLSEPAFGVAYGGDEFVTRSSGVQPHAGGPARRRGASFGEKRPLPDPLGPTGLPHGKLRGGHLPRGCRRQHRPAGPGRQCHVPGQNHRQRPGQCPSAESCGIGSPSLFEPDGAVWKGFFAHSSTGWIPKSRFGRRRKKFKIKAREIPCPEAYLSYAARTTG